MNITNIFNNFNNNVFSEEEELNSEGSFISISCVALGLLGNALAYRYRFNIVSFCQNIKSKINSSVSEVLDVIRTTTNTLFSNYSSDFPANSKPMFLAPDPLEEDSNLELSEKSNPIEGPSISSEHSGKLPRS
jgi:hypothetical protein